VVLALKLFYPDACQVSLHYLHSVSVLIFFLLEGTGTKKIFWKCDDEACTFIYAILNRSFQAETAIAEQMSA